MPAKTLTKKDLLEIMEPWGDDQPIHVCISDEADDLEDLETGSLLIIQDGGFVSGQHVLYVKPV